MIKCITFLLVSGMTFCAPYSQSLLGFKGLILTPAVGKFPSDGYGTLGYSNIKYPHTIAVPRTGLIDKANENHIFYGSLTFLPRLDLTGVITLAPGTPGNDGSETYKDFALFAHLLILKENNLLPSLTLGVHDFYSYSYYNALFLTTGKSFKISTGLLINTHLGYGVDWMNQHYGDTGPDRYDHVNHYLIGLFGGIEITYGKIFSFLIEHDSNQFNAGLRIINFENFKILISLLNMDSFSVGLNYNFSLL